MRSLYKKEDAIQGFKDLFEWRDTWLRAIALSWADNKLKERLLQDPKGFFEEYCNYKVPEMLAIKVVEDPEQRWEPGPKDRPWDFKWHLVQHDLTLHLPSPPDKKELQAIALSDYDATGAPYPFTVCV